jgi:hypothetical protein
MIAIDIATSVAILALRYFESGPWRGRFRFLGDRGRSFGRVALDEIED